MIGTVSMRSGKGLLVAVIAGQASFEASNTGASRLATTPIALTVWLTCGLTASLTLISTTHAETRGASTQSISSPQLSKSRSLTIGASTRIFAPTAMSSRPRTRTSTLVGSGSAVSAYVLPLVATLKRTARGSTRRSAPHASGWFTTFGRASIAGAPTSRSARRATSARSVTASTHVNAKGIADATRNLLVGRPGALRGGGSPRPSL